MQEAKFIILLLFAGFNLLLALALLTKACADSAACLRARRPALPAGKRIVATSNGAAWTKAALLQRSQAHAA